MPQPAYSGSQISISDGVIDQTGTYYIQTPKIASLQDGGFIAVWQQYTHTDAPYDAESSIQARVFNADGSARGAEFKVNGPVGYLGDERDVGAPDVAVLKDGRVLIAWSQGLAHTADYEDKSDARYRLFDPKTGIMTAVSDVVRDDPNDYRYHTDGIIDIAATADGGFLISCASTTGSETESSAAVFAFDSSGNRKIIAIGSDIGSNITGLTNGGLVYTHIKTKNYGPLTSTVLEASVWLPPTADRPYDSWKTIVINEAFTTEWHDPSVVALTNGNFAVVWCDARAVTGDGSGSSIKARIFRSDGTAASGDIIVNSTTAQHQINPVVQALPGGGFVVAFQDGDRWLNQDIRVATFNAMGGRTSDDFLTAPTMPGQQLDPSIAVLKDGRFVVSWRDVGFSIRAQIFGTATPNPDTNPDPDPIPDEQILSGSALNDMLDGTSVIGLFDGLEGLDTVSYATSLGHVVVFVDPAHSMYNQGDAARDRYTSIEAFIGTDYDDQFFGNTGSEQIFGGKGDDLLMGGAGNDSLVGGEGDDTLNGGTGADTLDGGAGDNVFMTDSEDTVINASGFGTQTVQASVSYSLSASAQIDILEASAKAGAINLTGNGLQNTIIGNASKNNLRGQGGSDKIFGGAGEDVLSGGTGKDIFVFDTKVNKSNLDKITDFSVKDDSLWLENKIFAKLGKAGTEAKPAQLKKQFFAVSDKAQDANDYLVYNKNTGVLSYDADGSGRGRAVEIATFANKVSLTYKDFFVI